MDIASLVKNLELPPSLKLITYNASQRGRRVHLRLALFNEIASTQNTDETICKQFRKRGIKCVIHYHSCYPGTELEHIKTVIETVPNPDAVQDCCILAGGSAIQFKYHKLHLFKEHGGHLLKELEKNLNKEIIIIDDQTGQKLVKSKFFKQLNSKKELDRNSKALKSFIKPLIHPTVIQPGRNGKKFVILYSRESKADSQSLMKEIKEKLGLEVRLKPVSLESITKAAPKRKKRSTDVVKQIKEKIEHELGDKLAVEKVQVNHKLMLIEIHSWVRVRKDRSELENEIKKVVMFRDYDVMLTIKGYLPEAEYIDSQEQLKRIIEEISLYDALSVDIEANGRYSYFENLCLIQFSTIDKDYLVDALLLKDDLTLLKPIFQNPDIQKIFHDPRWDVELLKKAGAADKIVDIFDTSAAYRALGNSHTSLDKLIETFFGITIDKKLQKADWGKRPLTGEMFIYAQVDTHFLIPMREKLVDLLNQKNRMYLLVDYCRFLETIEPQETVFNPNSFWKIKGSFNLEPNQQAVLQEIYLWREEIARKKNKPPYSILSNDMILEIAKNCPSTTRELLLLYKMRDYHVQKYGEEIIDRVKRGLNIKPPAFPEDKIIKRFVQVKSNGNLELPTVTKLLFSRLTEWRKELAAEMSMDPELILPKEMITVLVEQLLNSNTREIAPFPGFGYEKIDNYAKSIKKIVKEVLI
ncbi:MAG: ribonuclease D [Candidatus Odinarchaeota archaeon]